MQVQMTGTLLGTKKVDFENWQHVNLYILVSVKNGDGQQSQKFKFQKAFSEYEKYVTMIGQTIEIEGELESNDKGDQTIAVTSIVPIAGNIKKLAKA